MRIDHDILSKLLFAVSQLRYFEKEYLIDPNIEVQDIVIKWQQKVDSLLQNMGIDGYVPLNNLKDILKISFNADRLQPLPEKLEDRNTASYSEAS